MGFFGKITDVIYKLGNVLAILSLFVVFACILAQVVGRMIGVQVPDTDLFAGYAMVACCHLGLAYTLRAGGHIRVTLFTSRFKGALARWAEAWCLLVAIFGVGVLGSTVYTLVKQSYEFAEMSRGLVAVPIWVFQLPMLVGVFILELAFVEEAVRWFRREPQTYAHGEGEFSEM